MELTYNVKNNFLFVSGIVFFVIAALLLVQLVFADSTSSLLPSSDGAYLQWTPSTGTTHYTLVDESTCNGTTDYNSTNTVGNRDSYGISLASVPNGSTITAIEITPCASRNKSTGGGSATMDVFYRYNGVDSADAGNYALAGTTPTQLAATTFSGLSLVKGSSSALQIGAVLSAGTKGARLSRIAVVVTYTPLAAPTSLTATTSGTGAVLNWSDNATNEDGFKIERHNTATTTFSEIASVGIDVATYTDPGLSAGTYTYRVRAFNSGGFSGYSNSASTTIP